MTDSYSAPAVHQPGRVLSRYSRRVLALFALLATLLGGFPSASRAHTAGDNPSWIPTAGYLGYRALNPRFTVSFGDVSRLAWDCRLTGGTTAPMGWTVHGEIRATDADGAQPTQWQPAGGDSAWVCWEGDGAISHRDNLWIDYAGFRDRARYELRLYGQDCTDCPRRDLGTAALLVGTPPTPADFRATQVTACAVNLSWTDTPNEDHFELERADGGAWQEVARPPRDATSHVDKGLKPSTTYVYRIRATNNVASSSWSENLLATTGPAAPCDSDADGLDDSDERVLGTSPTNNDTDGDRLLDPWEVQNPAIEGDGFVLGDFEPAVASRDEVFAPYLDAQCREPDDEYRFLGQASCLNAAPDPLHKDVYLEIDWQDCQKVGCPDGDDMHHAPDDAALRNIVDTFGRAQVSNPDGAPGINLHILVDESINHLPNCDQDVSSMRATYFGTSEQRSSSNSEAVLAARELAVRYVWSGHSSYSDRGDDCPTPTPEALLATGFGTRPVEDFDWSPFGDANIGGRDILITLGPLWSCPSQIETAGFIHPCYRGYVGRPDLSPETRDYQALTPGIFPTSVNTGSGDLIALPYPVVRLLGLPEQEALTQLWGRTLMHLLGHSLGLDDAQVQNVPDTPATDTTGDGRNDLLRPDELLTWEGLQYAPLGDGTPTTELVPRYSSLVQGDHDRDGVAEGEDNCPGVPNASQADLDFDKWGNECDTDADGDGRMNPIGPDVSRKKLAETAVSVDDHPFDTDNDHLPNLVDADDDGDTVPDLRDNCPILSNPRQNDLDEDGFGDVCDGDVDGDNSPNLVERLARVGATDELRLSRSHLPALQKRRAADEK